MRQCSRCKKEKSKEVFLKKARGSCGLGRMCSACRKIENAAYHAINKKKRNTYAKVYHEVNKEKISLSNKRYREANREKIKKYREANKDKIKAQRDANKYKRKIYVKDNAEKFRGYCRKRNNKRRALKLGVNHESYRDNYIFERDGWICQLCGQKINRRLKYPNPRSKSIDHIVPLSKGGDDSPVNVQAAHLRCNMSKNAGNGGQLRLIG